MSKSEGNAEEHTELSTTENRSTLIRARDSGFVLVLSVPFVGQAIPYGIPLFSPLAAIVFGLAMLCAVWTYGFGGLSLSVGPLVPLLALIIAVFAYGVFMTHAPDNSLIGEILNGFSLLLLSFAAANMEWSAARVRTLLHQYLVCLVVVGSLAAILGLYKFRLLLDGELIDFVASAASSGYPWGTSLVTDYNFFSLTLLAGILAALYFLVIARRRYPRIFLAVALTVMITAGAFSGSRRFIVAAPLLIVMLVALLAHNRGITQVGKALVLSAAPVAVLGFLLHLAYGPIDWAGVTDAGWSLQERLAGIADTSASFSSRFVRWEFGLTLLGDWSPWVGRGFDYLQIYGCRFGGCVGIDYPHNPLISSLLFGGVVGLTIIIVFLLYLMLICARAALLGPAEATAAMILLATFLFVSISSNGVLSVKSFLIATLVCVVVTESPRKFRTLQSRFAASARSSI